MAEAVTVSKVTQLHRVAVIELSAGGGAPFENAMNAAASQARIIVIDCLQCADLPRTFIERLANLQTSLAPHGGHLIVVNAPDQAMTDLRFLGIDAATTTDLRFDLPTRSGFLRDDAAVGA